MEVATISGATPRAEEQQDHQAGQAGGDRALADHAGDGCLDEHALIEQEVDAQALGHPGQDGWQQFPDAAHDGQRRGIAAGEDGKQHRVPAVAADQVGLGAEPIVHEADVANVDHRPVLVADRNVVQLLQELGAAVDADVVLDRPHLGRARGDDGVLRQGGIEHVLRRQAARVERVRVDVDVHHPVLAAVGDGHRRALHGHELRADEVVAEIADLLFGQLVASQAEHEHRHVGGVVLQDQRRRGAGGQRPGDGLAQRRDLRDRRVDVGARLEEQLDHAGAANRLRFQVLDVADRRGQRPLHDRRDPVLHLVRRERAVVPDHADDRDVDLRKDVHRHRHDRQPAEDGDQQGEDDEGVGTAEGKADDPHLVSVGEATGAPRVDGGNWRENRSIGGRPCGGVRRHAHPHTRRSLTARRTSRSRARTRSPVDAGP